MTALVAAVEELRRLGADDVATEVAGRLAERFTRFDRDELRSDVRLVRRVLRAAGPLDPTVLRHAAVEVGDETGEKDGVFFRDPFVVTRLLDRTTEGAGAAMTALADEVGLAEPGWGTQDLASRTVRSGARARRCSSASTTRRTPRRHASWSPRTSSVPSTHRDNRRRAGTQP